MGCFENGNEVSGFIKYREFLNWLINCHLLKKSCALRSYLANYLLQYIGKCEVEALWPNVRKYLPNALEILRETTTKFRVVCL
jgi:hypothetical protein